MPILRRSCGACASAKRQCDLAVPRCRRCASRQISCEYINEPGAVGVVGPTRSSSGSGSGIRPSRRGRGREHRAAVLKKRHGATGPHLQIYNALRHEIIRTFDAATVRRQISILQGFAMQFARSGSNAFIHHYLYKSRTPGPLADVSSMIKINVNASSSSVDLEFGRLFTSQGLQFTIRRLVHLGIKAASFDELVSYVQAVALVQILRLFQEYDNGPKENDDNDNDNDDDDPERDNPAIWALAHKLWQRAPAQLPSSLSPWHAWLFAESVRRTLLVCNILLSVCAVRRRGFAVHAVCIEALPFDMRTRLWDADSEDAWREATTTTPADGDADGALPLVSFRQFKSLQQSEADALGCSPFETLLHLSFKDVG
ncbi:hypothetical protein F4777DRAFT_213315 [Nemania sp. FL0916]|nr:hypothetical protein F4777DRAFT_213315 [Nemania sp. FL0916]